MNAFCHWSPPAPIVLFHIFFFISDPFLTTPLSPPHPKMRLLPVLLLTILVIVVLAKNAKENRAADAKKAKERLDRPAMIRSRRSAYSAIWSEIKLAKEATSIGCKVLHTKACDAIVRQERNTPTTLESIVPSDVGALVEKATMALKKTTETDGFNELSETEQRRALLQTAGKQGEIVKETLKKAIDEARKTVDKALDTIVSYSEVSMEAKLAMKRIFGTLTDETKTPKQKVEIVKELEEKLSVELKDSLKPNTDPKVIDEAAHFFGNVPRQIELDKQ